MIKIAPSILSADFGRLGEEVRAVDAAGADWIHLDVMDGHFVPNLTIGPDVVAAVRKVTNLTLDTHLMIENADAFIPAFAQAGADILSVHVEACDDLRSTIELIRKHNVKPAVVINPDTPLSAVTEVLADVEMLLVMSVHPGFGGQSFIESALAKIERLRKTIDVSGRDIILEVDGGVNEKTAPRVIAAGATALVAGTAVYGGDRRAYADNIKRLRTAA